MNLRAAPLSSLRGLAAGREGGEVVEDDVLAVDVDPAEWAKRAEGFDDGFARLAGPAGEVVLERIGARVGSLEAILLLGGVQQVGSRWRGRCTRRRRSRPGATLIRRRNDRIDHLCRSRIYRLTI